MNVGVVHHHHSDPAFCGDPGICRAFSFDAAGVTCPWCKHGIGEFACSAEVSAMVLAAIEARAP